MNTSAAKVCVIGHPIGHSRSPIIHNYWMKRHNIAAEYGKQDVTPEALPVFIAGLAANGYRGCNVTLPHKVAALALTQPDDRARAVGAANTLWLDGGAVRSTNTDVEGFVGNLDASAPGWDRNLKRAIVLGAGGGAQGVVFGLLERKVPEILVVNRKLARAQELAQRFGGGVRAAAWDDISALLSSAGLLVNTTSVGMKGEGTLPIDFSKATDNLVVNDIVYIPLETGLLKAARARGLRTADGLGMLLHQAVRGFSLWFGVKPQVTPELRALVEADLAKA